MRSLPWWVTRAMNGAMVAGVVVWAGTAYADCCRLRKLPTEPSARVQACEPNESEECGAVLWESDVAPGEERDACPTGDRVVYREWDAEAGAFGPSTMALCGPEQDVEL